MPMGNAICTSVQPPIHIHQSSPSHVSCAQKRRRRPEDQARLHRHHRDGHSADSTSLQLSPLSPVVHPVRKSANASSSCTSYLQVDITETLTTFRHDHRGHWATTVVLVSCKPVHRRLSRCNSARSPRQTDVRLQAGRLSSKTHPFRPPSPSALTRQHATSSNTASLCAAWSSIRRDTTPRSPPSPVDEESRPPKGKRQRACWGRLAVHEACLSPIAGEPTWTQNTLNDYHLRDVVSGRIKTVPWRYGVR